MVRAQKKLEKLFVEVLPTTKSLLKALKLALKHREQVSEKVYPIFP